MIGWLGAALLAACAVPLTLEALIQKKVQVQTSFLWIWFVGEVLMLIHTLGVGDWALLTNYAANTLLLIPVIWVKIKEEKSED